MSRGFGPERELRRRRGFTLVEIVVSIAVFTAGVLGFAKTLAHLEKERARVRASSIAADAARQVLERMEAEPFPEVFRQFNSSSTDDPGGVGTGPGAGFAIPGLTALPGDADGLPGEIEFPVRDDAPGILREDVTDAGLGMPRDLSGDGAVDALDHSSAYSILPVRVRVRWLDEAGASSIELRTMLGSY